MKSAVPHYATMLMYRSSELARMESKTGFAHDNAIRFAQKSE